MIKHARRFDGALVQVTRVLSDDPCICDTAERKKKYGNHGCALAAVVSCLTEEYKYGKTKEGMAQGGRGKARGRSAGDEEGKGEERKEERKEEGKARGGDIAFSWKCEFCTYTNVDVARRDCRMCGTAWTAKTMKTGF